MAEEHKGRTFNSPLEERVYYSRLLGRDSSLVLHGGGNTSVKVTEKDHTGKEIQVLRVKGSGSDLATITEDGFTGLRMDDLLAARNIKEMSDEEMVAYMRKSMVDPSEPSPSVESFLHAFIPHAYVDHSHSDAILSITNTTMAPEEIKQILGNVMVIPYIPPGFKLARAILGSIESMGPEIRGIVLSRHGLFTFGESGKESYDRHMQIVAAAEKYINGKLKGTDLFPKKYDRTDPARVEAVLPAIRGLLSRSMKKVLKIATDEASLKISMSGEAEKLATNGPATPDMLIRTKFDYAYIDDVSKSADVIDAYAAKYREEYGKYVRGFPMHDPYPSCMVIRGFGLVTAGINSREASIAMDQMRHSLLVNARAMRLGGNSFISRKEAYDMEYWPLEEAKLKKFRPRPLEGHVSVVTGAASGIGLEVARKLSLNGSAVIACDLDPDVASVSKTLETESGNPVIPAVIDISSEEAVEKAYRNAVLEFGGVDMLFNNAGVLKSSLIEDTTVEDLDLHYRVNARGTFLMTREAFKIMKAQNMGGNMVFNITKNLTNPGPGMLSYGSTKAFAAHVCHYVAKEGGKYGIRANIVNPDKIFRGSKIWENGVLEARAKAKGQTVEQYKTQNLLRREVLPDHVANVVLALINEDAFGATTDAMIPIDGGII